MDGYDLYERAVLGDRVEERFQGMSAALRAEDDEAGDCDSIISAAVSPPNMSLNAQAIADANAAFAAAQQQAAAQHAQALAKAAAPQPNLLPGNNGLASPRHDSATMSQSTRHRYPTIIPVFLFTQTQIIFCLPPTNAST